MTTSQIQSGGNSTAEIHDAALAAAKPERGLSWLDIGCGRGDLLRAVRDRYDPSRLTAVDVVDWLADDLRDDVDLMVAPAERSLDALEPVDRVLLVETIEHLEAPWSVLGAACRLVAAGGRIVVTTPNVASLRHRLELLVRGQLTSFRPNHRAHMTPALPHVIGGVMGSEGLRLAPFGYAGRDVVPLTGGKPWPLDGELTSVSLVQAAYRLK
jgi:SAM-dependent methyltransferase